MPSGAERRVRRGLRVGWGTLWLLLAACGDQQMPQPSSILDFYAVKGIVKDDLDTPVAGATIEHFQVIPVIDSASAERWGGCGRGVAFAGEAVTSNEMGLFAFGSNYRVDPGCLLAIATPPADRALLPDTVAIRDFLSFDFFPPRDTTEIAFVLPSR